MQQRSESREPAGTLQLDKSRRAALWRRLIEAIEDYAEHVDRAPVTPEMNPAKVRALLASVDFERPRDPLDALDFIVEALWRYQTHVSSPRYFGLFNPAPTTMGIAADALVGAFNPQLAAWSKSPLGVEVEQYLVREFGTRFGYERAQVDGTFASGGMEANHTAVLAALQRAAPDYGKAGVRALPSQPVFYASLEAHHSFRKAARLCGLGTDALREIPVDANFRMEVGALEARISADRRAGFLPFMIAASAGTTNAGLIDPIDRIAEVAARENLWLHVDAAWGGAAALVPELRPLLSGIERSDSITFDAHKWLSVPMGAGIFICRHPRALDETFRVTAGGYMPRDAAGLDVVDPWAHSMQWSRRFTGLKVFLSLMVAGWEGYAAAIRHQVAMARYLVERLRAARWRVVSDTGLAVVCFVDGSRPEGASATYLQKISGWVVKSGRTWISTTQLGAGTPVLRVCITNYRTAPADIDTLVEALGEARAQVD
jgi:glutamate/tyrosine decarboxylase-like PLP-dependent enzyme